ncbi:Spermidine/putrescine import ATP-binding protein PotA [compost metagenome]
MQPKLMLLDEPLSALDAKIRKSLRLQIRQLQRRMGMTMIFVTHDQEEALMISDRICVMHNGRIVQEGSPEEIYSAPRTEFVARFIGNYNVLGPQEAGRLEGLAAQPGISYALRPESITLLPVGENAMTRPPSFSMPGYPSSSMLEYTSSGITERESSGMLRRDSFGVGHDLSGIPERDSSSELGHDSAGMLRRESGSGPGRESVVRGYDLLGMSRHLPPAGDSAALYWPGKVSSVMMLGNIVRYGIDVGGIPMTVDTLAGHGPFRPGEQSEVTLRIDRSQCIPLEKDGA